MLNLKIPDPFPLLHRLNVIIIVATIGTIRQHHECSLIRFHFLNLCGLACSGRRHTRTAAWRQQTLHQVSNPKYGAYSKSEHKG